MSTGMSRWSTNIHTFTMSITSTYTARVIHRVSRTRIGTSTGSWCIRIRISRTFTIGMGIEMVDR